jgi:beta-1,4-N-acetylglucosaminyltransferase
MKVALVSSIGGHLTDLVALRDAFADAERVWILNDRSPVLPKDERAYVVSHAERDLRVIWNLFEFAAILSHEKPDVIVSAGAGPAVPAALIARLTGVPFVYLECSCAVTKLTVTGRLMRPLARKFYVQWESLKQATPWATYAGGVL